MNTPITIEYATEKIKKALGNKDYEEADKWKKQIYAIAELNLRAKIRRREQRDRELLWLIEESYRRN